MLLALLRRGDAQVQLALLRLARDEHAVAPAVGLGFFLHVEDLDLCARFQAAGGDILLVPGIRVRHARSSSQSKRLAIEWHKTLGFRRYFTLENKILRALFDLARQPPKEWRNVKLPVIRDIKRGRVQTAGGAVAFVFEGDSSRLPGIARFRYTLP